MLNITRLRNDLIANLLDWKLRGARIGFVPTMGALHAGHLSLIEEARKHCDHVVVSIFVNPTQFNNSQDLAHYPRTEEQDLEALAATHCHMAYLPSVGEVYPKDYVQPLYALEELEKRMEGLHRPGHFQGVAAVLDRFFQDVAPDVACFGEKDFQQLAVVRKLVEIRQLPIEIIGCPTLREPNGLAMSSRNMRLRSDTRSAAGFIHDGLLEAAETLAKRWDLSVLTQIQERWNSLPNVRTEYLELASENNFSTPQKDSPMADKQWRLFTAVEVEGVRLIDNWPVQA